MFRSERYSVLSLLALLAFVTDAGASVLTLVFLKQIKNEDEAKITEATRTPPIILKFP